MLVRVLFGVQPSKYCVFKQRVWVAGMTQQDFSPTLLSGLSGRIYSEGDLAKIYPKKKGYQCVSCNHGALKAGIAHRAQ